MSQESQKSPVSVSVVDDWSKVVIEGPYSEGDELKPGQRVAALPKQFDGAFAWESFGEEYVVAHEGDLVVITDSDRR